VRGAVAEGHDVTVYCASAGAPLAGASRVVETLVVGGIRVRHRAIGVDRAYRFHDRVVASELRRRRDRFDVVHTWPLGGRRTLAVARDLGLAAVREAPNAHTSVAYELARAAAEEIGVELPAGHSHRFDGRRLAVEEAEYEAATAVLAPSAFVARTFRERAVDRVRVLRHRYGFDPAAFPAPPEARPERPFTVAFVGQGEPRKGLHHALAAWRISRMAERGARFVVCGRFVDAYRRAIDDLLAQDGVELRPFTSDVGAVLRASDALVLPSVEEGSALVTYEAQASGCALLVSDASGALMVDGEHGFVHRAGDVAALAEHLVTSCNDEALLGRIRAGVLARRDELSWAAAAVEVTAAYRQAIDGAD
jgi:glycosyltransferase involved in cell wall biosynthesis